MWPPRGLPFLQVPEYTALRERGRAVRLQLRELLAEEAALDERFYLHALQLPNSTHPAVVSRGTWGGGGDATDVLISPCFPSSCSPSVMRARPACWRWWGRSQVGASWGGGWRDGQHRVGWITGGGVPQLERLPLSLQHSTSSLRATWSWVRSWTSSASGESLPKHRAHSLNVASILVTAVSPQEAVTHLRSSLLLPVWGRRAAAARLGELCAGQTGAQGMESSPGEPCDLPATPWGLVIPPGPLHLSLHCRASCP